ncbi:MAG: heme o synthase, partial [Terriglobales bacterium]
VLLSSLALVPVSLAPALLGLAGTWYLAGAALLSLAYFGFGARLATVKLPPSAPLSKPRARRLLQASVVYLPLLFALMVMDGSR